MLQSLLIFSVVRKKDENGEIKGVRKREGEGRDRRGKRKTQLKANSLFGSVKCDRRLYQEQQKRRESLT